MVLFENIILGQYVEVKHKNHVLYGTVHYKGHLNGVEGSWVGVELEYPMGNHNGCWRGRCYFKCQSNHGIFIHASKIRFCKKARRLRDNYHKVSDSSEVDEMLFSPSPSSNLDCYSITSKYAEQAKDGFKDIECYDMFVNEKSYSLPHAVGRMIPAATMLKPKYSQISYKSNPTHNQYYFTSELEFCPKPSIPHYTMPHQALKRQVARGGWEEFGIRKPRFMSL